MLDNCFLQVVSFNEADCIAQDNPQRPTELLLFKLIATRPIGEPHDINLGDRKEIMRSVVEEQQSDILGERRFRRSANQVHTPTQIFRGKRGLCRQITTHLTKKLINKP